MIVYICRLLKVNLHEHVYLHRAVYCFVDWRSLTHSLFFFVLEALQIQYNVYFGFKNATVYYFSFA